jgi:hypothetical protein
MNNHEVKEDFKDSRSQRHRHDRNLTVENPSPVYSPYHILSPIRDRHHSLQSNIPNEIQVLCTSSASNLLPIVPESRSLNSLTLNRPGINDLDNNAADDDNNNDDNDDDDPGGGGGGDLQMKFQFPKVPHGLEIPVMSATSSSSSYTMSPPRISIQRLLFQQMKNRSHYDIIKEEGEGEEEEGLVQGRLVSSHSQDWDVIQYVQQVQELKDHYTMKDGREATNLYALLHEQRGLRYRLNREKSPQLEEAIDRAFNLATNSFCWRVLPFYRPLSSLNTPMTSSTHTTIMKRFMSNHSINSRQITWEESFLIFQLVLSIYEPSLPFLHLHDWEEMKVELISDWYRKLNRDMILQKTKEKLFKLQQQIFNKHSHLTNNNNHNNHNNNNNNDDRTLNEDHHVIPQQRFITLNYLRGLILLLFQSKFQVLSRAQTSSVSM